MRAAWHPLRRWDCCMSEDEKKQTGKLWRFGQIEVTPKDFYRQRQITDISMITVNRVVVSDKVYMVCHSTTKTLSIQYQLIFLIQVTGCLSIKIFGVRFNRSCLKN